jgi:hypothetical protein
VVENLSEKLGENEHGSHKFHMERFNRKKLNEVDGKEKYYIEVSGLQLWKIWTLEIEILS